MSGVTRFTLSEGTFVCGFPAQADVSRALTRRIRDGKAATKAAQNERWASRRAECAAIGAAKKAQRIAFAARIDAIEAGEDRPAKAGKRRRAG